MNQDLKIAVTLHELRLVLRRWREAELSIALVPTMGALHDGHLSLVRLAQKKADKVIVSLFVNPMQFAPGEDLDAYPRNEASDLAKLAKVGVDLTFLPTVEQMYPKGFATSLSVSGVSKGLCGAARPGHFDGVTTVVGKLLLQCTPDTAVFGEKDYQQFIIIKRLVTDLDLAVRIIGAPIVREIDGLALSSRNIYLSPRERKAAPNLFAALRETSDQLQKGFSMKKAAQPSLENLRKHGFELDYLELCAAQSLKPLAQLTDEPARLLIAAQLGRTRLIDNLAVIG